MTDDAGINDAETDIPAALRRDANNVAPFMRTADLREWGRTVTCEQLATAMNEVNREANPPALPPNWVPPWASKS